MTTGWTPPDAPNLLPFAFVPTFCPTHRLTRFACVNDISFTWLLDYAANTTAPSTFWHYTLTYQHLPPHVGSSGSVTDLHSFPRHAVRAHFPHLPRLRTPHSIFRRPLFFKFGRCPFAFSNRGLFTNQDVPFWRCRCYAFRCGCVLISFPQTCLPVHSDVPDTFASVCVRRRLRYNVTSGLHASVCGRTFCYARTAFRCGRHVP